MEFSTQVHHEVEKIRVRDLLRHGGDGTLHPVSGHQVDDCELCEAARFTHWYHEDDVCWVADCEACSTPMVVWKSHGTEPSEAEIEHMMARLTEAGDERFGRGNASIDRTMRQIPEHFHAHVRDRDWMTRRWSEIPTKYSGVGGERQFIR